MKRKGEKPYLLLSLFHFLFYMLTENVVTSRGKQHFPKQMSGNISLNSSPQVRPSWYSSTSQLEYSTRYLLPYHTLYWHRTHFIEITMNGNSAFEVFRQEFCTSITLGSWIQEQLWFLTKNLKASGAWHTMKISGGSSSVDSVELVNTMSYIFQFECNFASLAGYPKVGLVHNSTNLAFLITTIASLLSYQFFLPSFSFFNPKGFLVKIE